MTALPVARPAQKYSKNSSTALKPILASTFMRKDEIARSAQDNPLIVRERIDVDG